MSGITPSQTVGPYFAFGLTPTEYDWTEAIGSNLVTPDASGERLRIEGRVLDGDGMPINDSMIEIWQADASGRYADRNVKRDLPNTAFKGFGRAGTNREGFYWFETIKPGPVPGPDGKLQAPHLAVAVFSRGMLRHLYTRMYFSDEAANSSDQILALVPQDRRSTLIAKREHRAGQPPVYRFDICLQGDDETVFFDL